MNALAQQLYDLLSGLWHYGGTIAQLSAITNTTDLEVAQAIGTLMPIIDYRIEIHSGARWPNGIDVIWFLKPILNSDF